MGIDRIIITVMSGADDGKIFELDKVPFMIGRNADDDVYLPYDARVSRHHARITREEKSYLIEDVGSEGKGSSNKTYVNEKMTEGKTPISSGDMVLLGNVWIKFMTN